jgi:hypothetical protein
MAIPFTTRPIAFEIHDGIQPVAVIEEREDGQWHTRHLVVRVNLDSANFPPREIAEEAIRQYIRWGGDELVEPPVAAPIGE